MIYGDNVVYYTPVEAYPVMLMDGESGIISGGFGDGATVTQGVRFSWIYNPDYPDTTPSGFTGNGWFADYPSTPIWYSITSCQMTLQGILDGFADGTRTNLNDVFINWQNYVDAQGSQGNDVVKDFQGKVWDCWTNLNNG